MGEPMGPNNDLATKVVQELTAERDQLREEVNRLRTEAAELRRALEDAQREVQDKAAIVKERDCYLQALEEFWQERMAELDKNGVDFGDVVAEIEQDFRARGLLDGK
jgi:SMC interacting uncharacterized protein involved in chromosome segregation